ncbi:uncharacterized protein LOC120585245 [Pteropus medius]|uniref:uncharacterized protein LOC120585245 n=1 Tax=Pteropus vampyrus TaxID=132908 RepID=UPI00196A6B9D|nr:uncharacterized protein LOC120585245 [Pteropus giganteus]
MSPRGTAPGAPCDPVLGGQHAGVVPGSGAGMGRLPRGSPGECLAEENIGTGCLEGTPPQGTVWRVLGRRGAVCTVSSYVNLDCGVCPVLLSISSRSRVHGVPPPPPTEAPTLPLRGPKAGARGGSPREQGGREPRRCPRLGKPWPESAGRAGGRLRRIEFDITARSGRLPQPLPRAALHQKSLRKPGWRLLLFCRQLSGIWGEAGMGGCPRRGPWRELQVRLQGENWRRWPFPAPGWGVGPDSWSVPASGQWVCGSPKSWVSAAAAHCHAPPQHSRKRWLPRDVHLHSRISAWDLINVTSARVL